MGILNKLLKNATKKDLLNAVDKITDFVTESVKEREKITFEPVHSETIREKPQTRTFEDHSMYRSRSALIADFRKMLTENFAEYEILFDYSANKLDPGCHPACTPIEFLFKKNDTFVLAVVIVRQNTYRGMNVIGTKKICEKLNIPYIRFFEEYPNEETYVISRIRDHL